MSAAKDVALVERHDAPVAAVDTAGGVQLFERLARDPSVDVDKLERLMQMHERASARLAQEHFNAAMTAAQTEMRPIAADAENPQTRSRYASYAALDKALRPIYTKHGFALSFDTSDGAAELFVRVVCYVTHVGGHDRTYHADMPADGKGARGGDVMTRTHAVGAAISYGARYILKMIFNVAVGEDDHDGNGATVRELPPDPDGFASWWADLQSTADEGTAALKAAWDEAPAHLRKHLTTTNADGWNALKKRAAAVKVKA